MRLCAQVVLVLFPKVARRRNRRLRGHLDTWDGLWRTIMTDAYQESSDSGTRVSLRRFTDISDQCDGRAAATAGSTLAYIDCAITR